MGGGLPQKRVNHMQEPLHAQRPELPQQPGSAQGPRRGAHQVQLDTTDGEAERAVSHETRVTERDMHTDGGRMHSRQTQDGVPQTLRGFTQPGARCVAHSLKDRQKGDRSPQQTHDEEEGPSPETGRGGGSRRAHCQV